jgi:2-hydroxychromene-2-carboxylate isomerase
VSQTIDYYFAAVSPWAYLGHERFAAIARTAGAAVNVLPIDLGGQVFPVSGGLPLPKRAPQRQAYRLLELKRFSDWLAIPLNVQPKHFPVNGDDASRLILAVCRHDGSDAAMRLSGAVMRAVWAEERDVSARSTLVELLGEQGLKVTRIDDASAPDVQRDYAEATQQAVAAGVFGAPSYVIDGELFWGQDRLDFVERRLMQRR